MAAATSLAPYQPLPGLPTRDQLSNAQDYIAKVIKLHRRNEDDLVKTREEKDRIQAAHDSLKQMTAKGLAKYGGFLLQEGAIMGTAAAIGYANGRFGGEAGVVEKWGVSIDMVAAGVGLAAGFASAYVDNKFTSQLELLTNTCFAVGNTGLATVIARWSHQHGAERAQAVAAASPDAGHGVANGAKGGTVYSVHAPK